MAVTKKLEDFEDNSFEMSPKGRITSLEMVVQELHNAREIGDQLALDDAKSVLLEHVLQNSGTGVLVEMESRGRRYVVFSIGDCYIKVLISDGKYSVFPFGRTDLERLLTRHALEHAAICHYFDDLVPDTLFFNSPIEFDSHNQFSHAMNINPFIIQEGVENPKTLLEASKGPIAEIAEFRKSLNKLLSSFVDMGTELGLVPDIPNLGHQNVLADLVGDLWVVDTNTLVRPEEYHRFNFNFIVEVEELIKQLEKGHVEGNPQG